MPFKVGAAELEITPPLNTNLAGYFYQRKAKGVLEPIFVNCIVVAGEKETWALVSCDLIGVTLDITNKVRELVAMQTDLEPQQILICCTHTHTGPVISFSSAPFVREDAYCDFVVQRIVDCVVIAESRLEEAEAFCGRGIVEGVAFNRRYWMQTGGVTTNPGVGNPEIIRPAGPVDPEVGVIYFFSQAKSQLLGIIVNFALHADIVEGEKISPDFPGYMRSTLKSILGPNLPVLFTRGCGGDINHIDVKPKLGSPKRAALAEKIGKLLAFEVLKIIEDPRQERCEAAVWSQVEKTKLHLRETKSTEVEAAEKLVASVKPTDNDCPEIVRARRILKIAELGFESIETEVQVLGLGNVALAGLPSEIFVELGLVLKSQSPIPCTWAIDLANDEFDYVSTEKAYGEGGYEVNSSPLAPGAGEKLIETALKIINFKYERSQKVTPRI